MRKTFWMSLIVGCAAAALAGCGDDAIGTLDAGIDMNANAIPLPPILGTEIDRAGRPGINLTINNTFNPTSGQRDAAEDAYNAEGDPTMWASLALRAGDTTMQEFNGELAVWDALDGICGNQPLSARAALPGDGGVPDAGTMGYGNLALLLVDDQLYLDTSVTNCGPSTVVNGKAVGEYLAVETRALAGSGPATCGGRTPIDNVMDQTYQAFIGAGSTATNGIAFDTGNPPPGNTPVLPTTFPFLLAPN